VPERALHVAEHRHHRARLVDRDLGRGRRPRRGPLEGGNIRVARRELEDAAARPSRIARQVRDQRVVVRAGGPTQLDPRRVVAFGRVRREDARPGIGRPPGITPVAEQHPDPPPGQLVRGAGADQPAARHHRVVALAHPRIMPDAASD
jgi:hypothetical protein